MSDIFAPIEVQTTDVENPFDNLVGEGKKFATKDDLAKAKIASDAFIEQLKREAAELREQVKSQQTMDEILTKIRSASAPTPPATPAEPPAPTAQPDIKETVASLFKEQEAQRQIQNNQQVVEAKLREKWGADAQVNLNQKAKELGVAPSYLLSIAQQSPSLFFATLGIDQKASTQTLPAPRTSVQTPQPQSGERTKSHYDRLKATNPTEYFSPKVQNQMMKDAMKMREAFFDV